MEQNKIIRRQGILKENAYAQVVSDFTELFEDIEGASIVHTDANVNDDGSVITPENTIFYLDSNNYMYLKIVKDNEFAFRMTFNYGAGDIEGTNYFYIDGRDRSDFVTYSFIKTPYGVAFTIFPNPGNSNNCTSDSFFQNFFTYFEDENGNIVKTFINVTNPNDETGVGQTNLFSEEHSYIEKSPLSNYFLGSMASHTVLVNATSYGKPLVARHLYKKLQSENGKFGKIKLNGKTFVAGSHFCLECGEE